MNRTLSQVFGSVSVELTPQLPQQYSMVSHTSDTTLLIPPELGSGGGGGEVGDGPDDDKAVLLRASREEEEESEGAKDNGEEGDETGGEAGATQETGAERVAWRKIFAELMGISWPLVITFVLELMPGFTNVVAVGHLGQVQLAAVTLGVMVSTILSFGFFFYNPPELPQSITSFFLLFFFF